jgi:hypothetical protein
VFTPGGRLRNDGERATLPAGSVRYAIHNWTRHLPGEGISESGVGIVVVMLTDFGRFFQRLQD